MNAITTCAMDVLEATKFCCFSSLNVSFSFLLLAHNSNVLLWLSGLGGITGFGVVVVAGAVRGVDKVAVSVFVEGVFGSLRPCRTKFIYFSGN